MTRELLQQAFDERSAFEAWYCQAYNSAPDDFKRFSDDGMYLDPSLNADWDVWQAALAQRQPLTEDEIDDIWAGCSDPQQDSIDMHEFAQAIELHHGIGDKT